MGVRTHLSQLISSQCHSRVEKSSRFSPKHSSVGLETWTETPDSGDLSHVVGLKRNRGRE